MAANPKPRLDDPTPISISGVTPTPKDAEITYEGSIQFTASDDCTITWVDEHGKGNTYWDPQPGSVNSGANNPQSPQPPAKGHKLYYTLSNTMGTQGGGTVKVGSN